MTTETRQITLGRYDASQPTIEITRTINGRECRFRFDLRQPTHRYIYDNMDVQEWYEPESVKALMDTLREGDTFFDVGAHIGYFSIIAKALVGDIDHNGYLVLSHERRATGAGTVVAFEPNAQNAAACHASGIDVWEMAVSDVTEAVKFYTNEDNDGGHALWNPSAHPFNVMTRQRGKSVVIPAMTLDTLQGLRPTAIKIDTEGAEMAVLRGARAILEQPQLKLVICENNEWGRHQLGETQGPIEFMAAFGFKCETVGDNVNNFLFTR